MAWMGRRLWQWLVQRRATRIRAAMSILLVLSAIDARAVTFTLFPYESEFSDFLTLYHRRPNPALALEKLMALDIDALERKAVDAGDIYWRAVLMAFYVNVLHDRSDQVLPFARRIAATASTNMALFATEAIARSARQDRAEALTLLANRYASLTRDFAVFEAMPVGPYPAIRAFAPSALDIIWASYFSTGRLPYLETIAGTLMHYEKYGPEQVARLRMAFLKDNGEVRNGQVPDLEWVSNFLVAQTAAAGAILMVATDPAFAKDLQEVARNADPKIASVIETVIFHPDAIALIKPWLSETKALPPTVR
jgi:hypothetical protein